jgi:hypothetical protein
MRKARAGKQQILQPAPRKACKDLIVRFAQSGPKANSDPLPRQGDTLFVRGFLQKERERRSPWVEEAGKFRREERA